MEADQPHPTNIYEQLQIVLNPNGTLTRLLPIEASPPCSSPDPTNPSPALSKDVTINPTTGTWARLYLPRDPPRDRKLPLVLFFHGGGFILFSADSKLGHDFCVNLCVDLPAVIVSVDYRLAPEHRLPSAYEDAVEALYWVRTASDEWVREYADLDMCFLMGQSSGGNIAYHAGLRVAEYRIHDLSPMKIRGLILHHPFFGGVGRTHSELAATGRFNLTPVVSDVFWDLSLPVGVDRDHEYSNPTVGGGSTVLTRAKSLGWTVMVVGTGGDPLIDRQIEFAKMLEEIGVHVVKRFSEGGFHLDDIVDPVKGKAVIADIKSFVALSSV